MIVLRNSFLVCLLLAFSACVTETTDKPSTQASNSPLTDNGTTPTPTNVDEPDVEFLSVLDILIREQGWTSQLIGPIGQSYTIDVDSDGNSILALHPLIKQQTLERKSTKICSLFSSGRLIKFSSAVLQGYDDNAAIDARVKFLTQGEDAMTDKDWLLIDKKGWITYLREGFNSHPSCAGVETCSHVPTKYYDAPLEIQNCSVDRTIMKIGNDEFSFPNLILTMPTYVYLSKIKPNETPEGYKSLAKNVDEYIALFNRSVQNVMGHVDACLITTEQEPSSEPHQTWLEARSSFFDTLEQYHLIASFLPAVINTKFPGLVDTSKLSEDGRSGERYKDRFDESLDSSDCFDLSENSFNSSLFKHTLGLLHFSAERTFQKFEGLFQREALELKVEIMNRFPDTYLFE